MSLSPNSWQSSGQQLDFSISVEPAGEGEKHLQFDQDWLSSKASFEPSTDGSSKLIFNSSGSTGVPKLMGVSMANMVKWTDYFRNGFGHDLGPRLVSLPVSGALGYPFILKSLCEGQLVIGNKGDISETMQRAHSYGVKELLVTPLILQNLCDHVSTGGVVPDFAHIVFGGAMALPGTVDQARKLFPNTKLRVEYGATEICGTHCGLIDGTKPSGWIGYLTNDFEYRLIRNENEGVLKIRPPEDARIEGYYGGPEIYDDEGWYVTGDRMRVEPDGSYVFLGRADHVLNFGGLKIAPEQLEAKICDSFGIDVCAVSPSNSDHQESLRLFLPYESDAKPQEIAKLILEITGINLKIEVQKIDTLPRVENGKLDRQRLLDI